MTKITTDFVGTESTVVTKSRLTEILAYWGASTAGYTTWGQARADLNVRLLNTTAGVIGNEELAGSFLPKINFLNDPDDMVLDALFGAGEQGVWFDPSDVANIDWRRNLLTYSQEFTLGSWGVSNATISSNVAVAPDSTTTADKLVPSTNTNAHYVGTGLVQSTLTHTISVYAKADGYRYFQILGAVTSGQYANFDLTTGTVSATGPDAVSTISPAGSGWYRCSITITGLSAVTTRFLVVASGASGWNSSGLLGDGVSGILIWGAQLELGSVATEYQPITNLNNEIIARFPDATMYQDFMGTTPVYAPNQPVGLRLDKSKGLVRTTVGTLPLNVSPWFTYFGAVRTANTVTCSAAGQAIGLPVVPGRWYRVTADASSVSGSLLYLGEGSGTNYGTVVSGPHTRVFNATSTSMLIYSASAAAVTYNSITVQEIAGNHATQSTDISRPLYGIEPAGGRRNLLTYTENFLNAYWTNVGSAAITAYSGVLPSGVSAAQQITDSNAADYQGVRVGGVSIVIGATYTASVFVKKTVGAVTSYPLLQFSPAGVTSRGIILNTTTGTSSPVGAPLDSGVIDAGTYWRIFVTEVATTTSTTWDFFPAGSANGTSISGAAVGSAIVSGAQLELNTAPTPYQKVVSDYEVTEAGVQTCHYCNYDGTNDGMVTNSIDFTATDKMSVFVAVRKLGTNVIILETSASASANSGSMQTYWGFTSYQMISGGSLRVSIAPPAASVPSAELVSQIMDISGDSLRARINGVQVDQSSADQGTGNFGNYPLFIGRRNNGATSPNYPFNGRDYGIIVTGKLASSTQIGNAENFLLNKLGSLAPVITGVPTIGVN